MSTFTGLLSDICLLFGGLLVLTGGVGLLRLPDFFTRLHAASVTESAAAPLLIVGIMLDTGMTLDSLKLVIVIVIMVVANPTITHALCRAAAHGGKKPAGFKQPEQANREDVSSNNSTS